MKMEHGIMNTASTNECLSADKCVILKDKILTHQESTQVPTRIVKKLSYKNKKISFFLLLHDARYNFPLPL